MSEGLTQEQHDILQRNQRDMRWLLNDKRGRRFIARIIEESGFYDLGLFTGNSTTFKLLGKREIGASIIIEAEAIDSDLLHKARKELKQEREDDERRGDN